MEEGLATARDGRERWYYCLACQRVWQAATWQLVGWACPSSMFDSWPEFHPHIGWSYVSNRAGGLKPTEGRHVALAAASAGHSLPAAG